MRKHFKSPLYLYDCGISFPLFSLCISLDYFQNESVTSLKKARQQYFQRCDELEKAKAISAKTVDDTAGFKTLDKRRKSKDEAQTKVFGPFTLLHYFNQDTKL